MYIRTQALSGRVLDWAVAKTQGFAWARNMARRSGDMWDSTRKPRFPVDTLFFIPPMEAKDLEQETRSQFGWALPVEGMLLAPAALHWVPNYSTRWYDGGVLIEKYISELMTDPVGWYATTGDTFLPSGENIGVYAESPLVASCRAIVYSKMGGKIEVPDEIVVMETL